MSKSANPLSEPNNNLTVTAIGSNENNLFTLWRSMLCGSLSSWHVSRLCTEMASRYGG